MELIKLFVESIVEIIHYTIWPAVALIILLIFRKELTSLIGRLKEYEGRHGIFRFGDTKEQPVPALAEKTEIPTELSNEANRILATLWNRQTYHFKDDYSRRWSFRIIPNADQYGVFILGFAELLKLGLIGWTRKDGQALLTDKGIDYIKDHPEIRDYEDIYRF